MVDGWYLEIGYCNQIKSKLYQTSIIIKVNFLLKLLPVHTDNPVYLD